MQGKHIYKVFCLSSRKQNNLKTKIMQPVSIFYDNVRRLHVQYFIQYFHNLSFFLFLPLFFERSPWSFSCEISHSYRDSQIVASGKLSNIEFSSPGIFICSYLIQLLFLLEHEEDESVKNGKFNYSD